jgi:predicted dehydrogenase
MTPVSPVRIAVLGLGQTGIHHLEQLSLRSDLRVVTATASERDPRAMAVVAQFCDHLSPSVDDLLLRNDIDFVIISGRPAVRPELAIRALRGGKDVAVESPPCRFGAELDEMLAAAHENRRRLCPLPGRSEELDFRAALEAVRGGALGNIESARLISWGRALPGTTEFDEPASPESDEADDAFVFFAFQYLNQLFRLVRQPPRSVFARISPPVSSPLLEHAAPGIAFVLSVGLRDGGDANLDVNLSSAAPLHTGWVLAGSKGGYRGQRIYVADPSGEICDAPVAVPELADLDPYAPLFDPACSLRLVRHVRAVMRTIAAARQSSRLNLPVDLPSEPSCESD